MSEKETGGPAFPRPLPNIEVHPNEALRLLEQHQGMTLRDYFAATINMETDLNNLSFDMGCGLLGRECPDDSVDSMGFLKWWAEYRAIVRFIEADAMLKVRNS